VQHLESLYDAVERFTGVRQKERVQLVVIPKEERYLEARFPAEYLPYKASVRGWL
jgi:hypothetical protein